MNNIDKINQFSMLNILDRLGIKYTKISTTEYRLDDSDGWTYNETNNFIYDFSKDRGFGNPFNFIKTHFNYNSRETFVWFENEFPELIDNTDFWKEVKIKKANEIKKTKEEIIEEQIVKKIEMFEKEKNKFDNKENKDNKDTNIKEIKLFNNESKLFEDNINEKGDVRYKDKILRKGAFIFDNRESSIICKTLDKMHLLEPIVLSALWYDFNLKRMYLPLFNSNDEIVGRVGRIFRQTYTNENDSKYIMLKGSLGEGVYKSEEFDVSKGYVFVTEGMTDFLTMLRINTNVIGLRTANSGLKTLKEIVKKHNLDVYFIPDNDKVGLNVIETIKGFAPKNFKVFDWSSIENRFKDLNELYSSLNHIGLPCEKTNNIILSKFVPPEQIIVLDSEKVWDINKKEEKIFLEETIINNNYNTYQALKEIGYFSVSSIFIHSPHIKAIHNKMFVNKSKKIKVSTLTNETMKTFLDRFYEELKATNNYVIDGTNKVLLTQKIMLEMLNWKGKKSKKAISKLFYLFYFNFKDNRVNVFSSLQNNKTKNKYSLIKYVFKDKTKSKKGLHKYKIFDNTTSKFITDKYIHFSNKKMLQDLNNRNVRALLINEEELIRFIEKNLYTEVEEFLYEKANKDLLTYGFIKHIFNKLNLPDEKEITTDYKKYKLTSYILKQEVLKLLSKRYSKKQKTEYLTTSINVSGKRLQEQINIQDIFGIDKNVKSKYIINYNTNNIFSLINNLIKIKLLVDNPLYKINPKRYNKVSHTKANGIKRNIRLNAELSKEYCIYENKKKVYYRYHFKITNMLLHLYIGVDNITTNNIKQYYPSLFEKRRKHIKVAMYLLRLASIYHNVLLKTNETKIMNWQRTLSNLGIKEELSEKTNKIKNKELYNFTGVKEILNSNVIVFKKLVSKYYFTFFKNEELKQHLIKRSKLFDYNTRIEFIESFIKEQEYYFYKELHNLSKNFKNKTKNIFNINFFNKLLDTFVKDIGKKLDINTNLINGFA